MIFKKILAEPLNGTAKNFLIVQAFLPYSPKTRSLLFSLKICNLKNNIDLGNMLTITLSLVDYVNVTTSPNFLFLVHLYFSLTSFSDDDKIFCERKSL